jgi:hypothetical protein
MLSVFVLKAIALSVVAPFQWTATKHPSVNVIKNPLLTLSKIS